MPFTVTAQDGDTLCTIGIGSGFHDCLPLRALPENAAFLNRALRPGDLVTVPDLNPADDPRPVDQLHRFSRDTRQVGIRFVHGSRNLPFADDPTITTLNISNFTTNRTGATEGAFLPQPNQPGFNANADIDPDAFKVEVIETRAPGNRLDITLEALRPTYDAGLSLNGHTDYPDASPTGTAPRLDRTCFGHVHRVNRTRFRSSYMRLVVDSDDQQNRPEQTLLTTDMFDEGDPNVEVLDNDIRATYVVHDCPARPFPVRCRVEAIADMVRGAFVDVAVHILRAAPSGVVESTPGGPGDNGVVLLNDMRRRILMFCRRHWAQCITKFRIVLLRTVDLPSDMLTVSDATGNLALGLSAGGAPGVVGFTINVQRFDGTNFGPINVPPVTVLPGATPDATANLIKAAIEQTPGLTATVSVNPAEVGDPRGSADILIRDAGGGRITITNLTAQAQQDTQQVVAVNSVGLAFNIRNALADYHVGHPDERNLYNTFDTGASRIDIFVAQSFVGRPNLLGFTVCSQTDLNATRQPLDAVRNTIIMRQDSADGTNFQRYALPHEVGHVLLDDAMHADNSRQLMFPTLHGAVDVNDPKRLIGVDPPATNWENLVSSPDDRVITRRIRMNALSRVLDKAQGLRHF